MDHYHQHYPDQTSGDALAKLALAGALGAGLYSGHAVSDHGLSLFAELPRRHVLRSSSGLPENLERVMNFGQALLAPVAEGEVAVWKGLEHRWVLRAGCG